MSYAAASTIKTITCIINNTNAAGSGFGVTPDEEGVFIPSRVMESARLDIGDKLKVFAQDNHADPDTQHYTARWRAIRVVIEERFSERVGEPIDVEHPVPKPIVAPKAAPKFLSAERVIEEVDLLLAKNRPWSVRQMVLEIEDMFPMQREVTGMETTIKTYLDTQFTAQRVAKAVIFTGSAPGSLAAVYYATNTEVLEEHLSTALED